MGLGVLGPRRISKKKRLNEKRKETDVNVFRLVFVWTSVSISVLIIAVSRGILTLTGLGRGKKCTLCGDGAWLWLFWKYLELS
jgi:hypothetical protein